MAERTVNVVLKGDGSGAVRAVLGVDSAVEKLGDDIEKTDRKLNDTFSKKNFRVKIDFDVDGGGAAGAVVGIATKATKAGKAAGDSFMSGMSGALRGGMQSPYVMTGIVGAVAATTPAISMLLSNAVLAGLGSGVIAGGIALAAQDPRVNDAGTRLGKRFMDGWTLAASPFIAPVERSLERLGFLSDRVLNAGMRKNFEMLAPYVDKLSVGFDGFVMRMMPGINSALSNLRPILDGIANGLPDLGAGIGDFFDELSQDSERLGHDIESVIRGMGSLARGTGTTLSWLSSRFNDGVELTIKARRKLGTSMADIFAGQNGVIANTGRIFAGDAQRDLDAYTGKVKDAAGAVDDYTTAATPAEGRARALADAFGDLANSAGGVAGAFDAINSPNLDYFDATTKSVEATNELKEALKESGGAIDTKTEKSMKARDALSEWIEKEKQLIVATGEQVAAQHGAGMGAEAARAQYERSREALVGMLTAAGMSKVAVEELANQLFAMPRSTEANISTPGTRAAQKEVADLEGQIAALKGKQVQISEQGAPGAQQRIAALQAQIDRLQSKTIQINTILYEQRNYSSAQEFRETRGYRWGGMSIPARHGLVRADVYRAGARPLYSFAEPETGGEAFVPRKGNYGRSMGILQQAAGWYGASVTPNGASGGGTQTLRVILQYPDGRVIQEQLITYADNTGQSPASLLPVRT
jgi:hypothetical protein